MKTSSFVISASFPFTPEVIFTALTDSCQIRMWSGQRGNIKPVIGREIRLFDDWAKGNVLAFEPGKKLSFTWKPAEWPKNQQATIVVYTFKQIKSKTKLTLKQMGFPSKGEMQSHKNGWAQFVFEPLKAYLLSM